MTDYCGLIIIRINLPQLTDVKNCECMLNHIKSVIKRETGVNAEVELYD